MKDKTKTTKRKADAHPRALSLDERLERLVKSSEAGEREMAEMRRKSEAAERESKRQIAEIQRESKAADQRVDKEIKEMRRKSEAAERESKRQIAEIQRESKAADQRVDKEIKEMRRKSEAAERRMEVTNQRMDRMLDRMSEDHKKTRGIAETSHVLWRTLLPHRYLA